MRIEKRKQKQRPKKKKKEAREAPESIRSIKCMFVGNPTVWIQNRKTFSSQPLVYLSNGSHRPLPPWGSCSLWRAKQRQLANKLYVCRFGVLQKFFLNSGHQCIIQISRLSLVFWRICRFSFRISAFTFECFSPQLCSPLVTICNYFIYWVFEGLVFVEFYSDLWWPLKFWFRFL